MALEDAARSELDRLEGSGIDVMETASKQELLFGHAQTHDMADEPAMERGGRTDEQLEAEHDSLAVLMEEKGINHKSPLNL